MKKNSKVAARGAERHATWGDIIALLLTGLVAIGILVAMHLHGRKHDAEIDETIRRVDAFLKEIDAKDAARKAAEERKREEDRQWWLDRATNAVPDEVEEDGEEKAAPCSAQGVPVDQLAFSRTMNREELIYEIDVLAETLWCEARGEGKIGVEAVASVVMNRAKRSGKKVSDVCLQRKQFSCWNNRTRPVVGGDRKFIMKPNLTPRDTKIFSLCRSTAYAVVIGTFIPTVDSTHYYAHNKVTPKWAQSMWNKQVIGNHTFGRV